jgi:hypothetical protein
VHVETREPFNTCCIDGSARCNPNFENVGRTRSRFKLALKFQRDHLQRGLLSIEHRVLSLKSSVSRRKFRVLSMTKFTVRLFFRQVDAVGCEKIIMIASVTASSGKKGVR